MDRKRRLLFGNNVGRGAAGAAAASFSATLLSSLVPEVYTGSSTPTFTRATTAYVTDFEGLLKQVPSGCARLGGARFVRNKLLKTEDLANAAWTKANGTVTTGIADPLGGTTAFTWTATAGNAELYQQDSAQAGRSFLSSVWIRRRTGTGGILLYRDTAATVITAAVTSSWQCLATTVGSSAAATIYFDLLLLTSGDAVDVWHPMWEDVTGQSNQNPSEYVSVGVLSAPYHGAGVDGCKYFTTQNGNTVASNVVTEATGAAISSATLLGYQAEGLRTNRCLQSQVFSSAAWVSGGGGIAVTDNSIAAPDGTTTADTLTASGANGTLIQDLGVVASAAKAGGLWIKRKTGTGNVDLTLDGGATWTNITVTAGWTRVQKTQTLADEDFGIRIVTSGDEVYVWQGQVETASFLSSGIPTTTVAVARNGDVLSYDRTSNLDLTIGTAYAEYQAAGFPANQGIIGGLAGNLRVLMCDNATTCWMYDGVNLQITGAGTSALNNTVKVAGAWGGAGMYIDRSGSTTATSAFDGSLDSAASFGIGQNVGNQLFGNVRNVSIWTIKKTQAEVEALVA